MGSSTITVEVNGRSLDVARGASVADVIQLLQLPPRAIAVEVNQQLIPRAQYQQSPVQEGDRLEVVSLAGGG